MSNETAVIANITDQSYLAHRTYGTFQINGRSEAEAYALLRVTPRTAVMDYGDKRTLPLQITAREIANDICREINSDAGERSFLGVFVCAGDAPTEEELRGAREKLDSFYSALVASADREWERSHSYLFIHDLQRRAAAHMGLEKEWFYRARETADCPGCGERVKPNVALQDVSRGSGPGQSAGAGIDSAGARCGGESGRSGRGPGRAEVAGGQP